MSAHSTKEMCIVSSSTEGLLYVCLEILVHRVLKSLSFFMIGRLVRNYYGHHAELRLPIAWEYEQVDVEAEMLAVPLSCTRWKLLFTLNCA